MSDNGPYFASKEFEQLQKGKGLTHITSAPYPPASNGLAERAVRTVNGGLRKLTMGSLVDKLSRFLFQYSLTSHSTTGISPVELIYGRRRLDSINPLLKLYHDRNSRDRIFQEDDDVFVKMYKKEGQVHGTQASSENLQVQCHFRSRAITNIKTKLGNGGQGSVCAQVQICGFQGDKKDPALRKNQGQRKKEEN